MKKTYETDDMTITIRILNDPHVKGQKILNIQYGNYKDIGPNDEVEMLLPKFLLKARLTNTNFAKHIINYFIKE